MKGKRWIPWFLFILIVLACKHKKKISLSGEEPVNIKDFIASFKVVNLPYQVLDSEVARKKSDTLLISYKVFTSLVPDTILDKAFGKGEKPKIYPLARVGSDQGTYLFVKGFSSDRKAILVLCFDKKDNFITGMPVLQLDANPATQQF